jgi:hypothetical protein
MRPLVLWSSRPKRLMDVSLNPIWRLSVTRSSARSVSLRLCVVCCVLCVVCCQFTHVLCVVCVCVVCCVDTCSPALAVAASASTSTRTTGSRSTARTSKMVCYRFALRSILLSPCLFSSSSSYCLFTRGFDLLCVQCRRGSTTRTGSTRITVLRLSPLLCFAAASHFCVRA